MIFKYALKEWKLYWRINGVIFFQLFFTFFIVVLCTTSVIIELKYYWGVSSFCEKDGYYIQSALFTYPDQMHIIRDSTELKQYLKNAEVYGSSDIQNSGFDLGERSVPVNIRAYDDTIIRQFQPRIKDGNWIMKSEKSSKELHAVITKNRYGIRTGDVIYAQIVVNDSQNTVNVIRLPIRIAGVLDDGMDFWGESLPQRDDINYKSCYQKFYMEEADAPIILISKETLLSLVENGMGYRVSMSLTGSCFVTYHEDIAEAEKEYNLSYIKDNCDVIVMEELGTMSHNNRMYLGEKLLQLSPVLSGALLFTLLSQISIRAIVTNLQLNNYSIYQLCGISKKQCCFINILSNTLLMVTALILASIVIFFVKRLPVQDLDLAVVNGYQIAVCSVVMAVNVAISSILPMITICRS